MGLAGSSSPFPFTWASGSSFECSATILFSFQTEVPLKRNKAHFTHLHLVILIFLIFGLPIHAGKEVYAVGADQVDGALAPLKIKFNFRQKVFRKQIP